jgi:hypothetical protein
MNVRAIMTQMPFVFKPQIDFMVDLFGALKAFSGRATMRNLSRYGAGSESRVARWCRKQFKFKAFNLSMLENEECGLDLSSIKSHPNYAKACAFGIRAA